MDFFKAAAFFLRAFLVSHASLAAENMAPATQPTSAFRETAQAPLAGPAVLGLAVPLMDGLASLSDAGETGDGDPLAPTGLQAVLALEIKGWQSRST